MGREEEGGLTEGRGKRSPIQGSKEGEKFLQYLEPSHIIQILGKRDQNDFTKKRGKEKSALFLLLTKDKMKKFRYFYGGT